MVDTFLANNRACSLKEELLQMLKKSPTRRSFMCIKPLPVVKVGTPQILAPTALPLKTKERVFGLPLTILLGQKWLTTMLM
jgi:hypothetical protein